MEIEQAKRRIKLADGLKKLVENFSIEKSSEKSQFEFSRNDNVKNKIFGRTFYLGASTFGQPINIYHEHDFVEATIEKFLNTKKEELAKFLISESLLSVKQCKEGIERELIDNLSLINKI